MISDALSHASRLQRHIAHSIGDEARISSRETRVVKRGARCSFLFETTEVPYSMAALRRASLELQDGLVMHEEHKPALRMLDWSRFFELKRKGLPDIPDAARPPDCTLFIAMICVNQ